MRPRICLRYLTRFGSSILSLPLHPCTTGASTIAVITTGTAGLRTAAPAAVIFLGRTRQHGSTALAVAHDFAVEDPHLDADDAVGGLCPCRAVINVRPQSLERNATVRIPLRARLFGSSETAGAADLDALGAGFHNALDGLLHRPAEGEAAFQLIGDALGYQLGVGVRVRHLLDVHGDGATDLLVQAGAQGLDRLAAAANHDAGLGGVDGHVDVVCGAVDVDAGDAGAAHVIVDGLADLLVLTQQLRVLLRRGVPVGRGNLVDTEAKAPGVDLVTHVSPPM